jgi:hypothetical protein
VIEPRQISAGLDTDSIEQRCQRQRRLQHTDRIWSDVITLRTRWYHDQRTCSISRRYLGTDGDDRNRGPHLLHAVLVEDLEQSSGHGLSTHAAGIGPDRPTHSQHHPWSNSEQERCELVNDLTSRFI